MQIKNNFPSYFIRFNYLKNLEIKDKNKECLKVEAEKQVPEIKPKEEKKDEKEKKEDKKDDDENNKRNK